VLKKFGQDEYPSAKSDHKPASAFHNLANHFFIGTAVSGTPDNIQVISAQLPQQSPLQQ
jgi:hypothetical protein